MRSTVKALMPPIFAALILCLLWENIVRILEVPVYVLPAPSDMIMVLFERQITGEYIFVFLLVSASKTGIAALTGFLLASILGILIGTILASVGVLRRGVYPLANILQMVPIIALAPLLNIWFGYGIIGVSAAACIVSIFPVIANTVDGLRSVDPQLVELFEIYGSSPRQRWRMLELPAALPQIFTGLRIAAGLAVIGAVVGELVSGVLANPPIGAVIATHLRTGKLEVVFAAILFSAMVGFGLFGLVSWTARHMLGSWHASSQRERVDEVIQDSNQTRLEHILLRVTLAVIGVLTLWAFAFTQPSKNQEGLSSIQVQMKDPSSTHSKQSSSSSTDAQQSDPKQSDSSFIDAQQKTTTSTKTTPLERVRIQLNWMPEPEFGGIYTAQLNGYDREEGLDFEIIAGGPGTPSSQLTASGKVEFGVVEADQVITMRSQGAKLVAVYACFQIYPRAIITHLKSAPKDLEVLWKSDHRVAVEAGETFVKWLNLKYGGEQLKLVTSQGGLSQFKQDSSLAQAVYVFSEPVSLSLDQVPTRIYPIAESGYNPYAVVITTSEAYLRTHPEIVLKLRRVMKRGWERYLSAPEETNRVLSKMNPSMTLEAMNKATEIANPYITGSLTKTQGGERGESELLGEMSVQRWRVLGEQLTQLGLVSKVGPPQDHFWPTSTLPASADKIDD